MQEKLDGYRVQEEGQGMNLRHAEYSRPPDFFALPTGAGVAEWLWAAPTNPYVRSFNAVIGSPLPIFFTNFSSAVTRTAPVSTATAR
jgi:hypothetical protein